MAIAIRPAGAPDVAAIDALLRASFPAPDEADLVRRLCVDGDMVLMLVAIDEDAGTLAGAIAFSRMRVMLTDVDGGEKAVPAVALAPLAVAPEWRQQGVAEALVRGGIDALEAAGVVLCFVLGEPGYYERFGFHADHARNFASPYAGDYFMALPLQGGLMPCGVRGAADHAGAFAALG
ncbi:GNAT family N-acetyltransferase [Sphingomonas adhaesiva]|uniref:GNAT family N-acetyltransferase n=1 Tax=Sphingomonas adhaesiva TaxID=28212 RepID=UPI002FFA3EEF